MNTIIKAILRFFKYSKLSFIGLFLLIFFSSSVFTTLNNTTINLNTSYSKISNDGNLHDFVINENYRYGTGNYVLNTNITSDSSKTTGNLDITSITSNTSESSKTTNTYNVTFALNTTLASSDENNEVAWTYAYKQILNKYLDNTLENKDDFAIFVTFSKTITSTSSTTITKDNWTSDTNFVTAVNDFISTKQTDLNSYVSDEYKNIYLNDLEKTFNVSVRSFDSINITNTKQNIFFKVIQSDPNYSIDKLVIYDGNNLNSNWDIDFSKYKYYTSTDYTNDAELSRVLVPYLYRAKWSDDSDFKALNDYVETHKDYNPYTNTPTATGDVKTQATTLKSILDQQGVSDKGYSISFSYRKLGLIPITGNIYDFTGYQIVIGPDYLKTLNKKPLKYEEWTKHQDDTQKEFEQWMSSLPDENKILIDNQEFIIMGAGISPDFMYPILSFQNVVPSPSSEQVVYLNKSGYEKVVDGFRGNEQETFLVAKFPNDANKKDLLKQINIFNQSYMAWPSNINSTYLFDDVNNTFSPTALRMQFIPKVVLTMTTISAFLTTFIVLLSVFISIVIIQRFIQINRNSLGIMQANGYKKWEIILGVCTLIIIPVIASTILGYIIGFSVQGSILNLLGSFWTIPTSIAPFSFAVMTPLLFIAIAVFMLVTILFTWWSLRGETAEFMKDEAKYKMSKIAQIMKKPFSKFNIMIRFRSAVAFLSIWRVLLLSIMSSGIMMSLAFSLNVLNTFQYASTKTFFEPRNYTYAVNLITPTLQSGQYYAVPYNSQGITFDKAKYFSDSWTNEGVDSSNLVSQNYDSSTYYGKYTRPSDSSYNSVFANNVAKYGNIQLVSMSDSTDLDTNAFYLKNKSTIKAFTDLSLGLGSLSSNPWDLAMQMMPPNNANYANAAYKNIFQEAVKDNTTQIDIGIKNSGIAETNTYYNYIKQYVKAYAVLKSNLDSSVDSSQTPKIDGISSVKETTIDEINANNSVFFDAIDSENGIWNYYFEFDDSKTTGNTPNLSIDVKIPFLNLLYSIYSNPKFQNYTYSINYGKIVIDNNKQEDSNEFVDSPFTYVNFNIEDINNKSHNLVDDFTATGLLADDSRISLKNNSDENINQLLWNTPTTKYNGYDVYPIIINSYAAKIYGLTKNDVLKVRISNSADRYSRQHFGVEDPIAYFKVVDITTTYQGAEFYLSQYDANKILGLTINNLKPVVPTKKEDIKDTIDWTNLEYDYATNHLTSASSKATGLILANKNDFIQSISGFNGIFSNSQSDLKQVTSGISLYSVSGVYPGVDKFEVNNQTIQKLFGTGSNKVKNIQSLIETTGFYDLAKTDASGQYNWTDTQSDWKNIVEVISNVFGKSASFSIVSGADSINSKYEVIKTISKTATEIQNIVLAIITIITVIIVIVISSIIINDSIKLAAILKCLGLADRNNALSFLSVYFPVFIIGLIVSIPLTSLLSYIYVQVILGFAGILLVINPIWWHYVIAGLGVIIIFTLSYWAAWKRISEMDLTSSIK